MNFGALNPAILEYVIDDVDGNLVPVCDDLNERFSIETGRCAKKIAGNAINRGFTNDGLLRLIASHEDDLTDFAKASYAQHRLTTREFMRRFGIDELDLYRAHHYTVCRYVIVPTFNRFANPRLQQASQLLRQAGLKQVAFTNGTEYYAKDILRVIGSSLHYSHVVGIDSTGDRFLMPKQIRGAWRDFFRLAQIPSITGWKVWEQNFEDEAQTITRSMKPQDWDFSHCILFDDSPEVLEIAKLFGIQTVLVESDRVSYDPIKMPYIDAVTDNPAEFKCRLASHIVKQKVKDLLSRQSQYQPKS
jgi:FMN phosphatase YigB (HAD superfamily)